MKFLVILFSVLIFFKSLGTRVGRVRVIFQLPSNLDAGLGLQEAPASWPRNHLAYIEWYRPQERIADDSTGMYVIKKTKDIQCSVVSLKSIRQSCMLIPKFDDSIDWQSTWTSANILDSASTFFLNNWQSSYAYQTIW